MLISKDDLLVNTFTSSPTFDYSSLNLIGLQVERHLN